MKKAIESLNRPSTASSKPVASHSHHHHRSKSAKEQADEDLQRAIQMSLEDAGMVHGPRRADYVPETPRYEVSEPPLVDHSGSAGTEEEDDPDMRAAIEASLREANAPKASAPVVEDEPAYSHPVAHYEPSSSHVQVCSCLHGRLYSATHLFFDFCFGSHYQVMTLMTLSLMLS